MFAELRIFHVYRNNKLIDTVYYWEWSKVNEDDVKQSLIQHDGYSANIVVREEKWRKINDN